MCRKAGQIALGSVGVICVTLAIVLTCASGKTLPEMLGGWDDLRRIWWHRTQPFAVVALDDQETLPNLAVTICLDGNDKSTEMEKESKRCRIWQIFHFEEIMDKQQRTHSMNFWSIFDSVIAKLKTNWQVDTMTPWRHTHIDIVWIRKPYFSYSSHQRTHADCVLLLYAPLFCHINVVLAERCWIICAW